MANVTVELPSMLCRILGSDPAIAVEASSIRGGLEGLFDRYPAARVHLFDESGNMRQHVLCFHNGVNTRWLESLEVPVVDGDTVTIVQAVSGG